MIRQFKDFLTKTNALALAVGVIIGGATGKMVTGIVDDLLMPVITLILPAGNWREHQIVLKEATDAAGKLTVTAVKYGDLAGILVDFLIIAWVVFFITKWFLGPGPVVASPELKDCPECLEKIPTAARKCRACGSTVA